MAALPKRKPSSRRQGRRRASHRIKLASLGKCKTCGADKVSGLSCLNCQNQNPS